MQVLTLWIAGRWRVGPEKAQLRDAFWISTLSIVSSTLIGTLFGGIVGFIPSFIVTLFLTNRYYETDWSNSLIISVMSIVIVIVTSFFLAIIGLFVL